MEDSYFLESMEKIQRAMYAIQGNFLYMLSDRDHLYDPVHMLFVASLKDEEEICKIGDVNGHPRFFEKQSKFCLGV